MSQAPRLFLHRFAHNIASKQVEVTAPSVPVYNPSHLVFILERRGWAVTGPWTVLHQGVGVWSEYVGNSFLTVQ